MRKLLPLLLVLLVVSPLHADELSDLRAENQRLRAKNAELKQRLAALEKQLGRATEQTQDLQHEKTQLERLAGVTTTGERVESERPNLRTVELTEGSERIATRAMPLDLTAGSRANHYLVLSYPTGTADPMPPVTAAILTQMSGGIHKEADTLTLTVDGQPRTLERASYEARKKSIKSGKTRRNTSDETARFAIDPDLLRELARASTLEGRLGRITFTLDPQQIASFRALRERMRVEGSD